MPRLRLAGRPLAAGLGLCAAVLAVLAIAATASRARPPEAPADRAPPALASVPVAARAVSGFAYEGMVEARRQTEVAAPVAGAVVALPVRAGDRVQTGQVLARIDARAADQAAAAGVAHARAARATLDAAGREHERQQQLFAQGFISRAALDRADTQLRTAEAEASAQLAEAGAARTRSDLHVVRAPYGGVVAGVAVALGDMASPGRPLLTLYDPAALRVAAAIPESAATRAMAAAAPRAEIPGVGAGRIEPVEVQWLPTVDAASHTLTLRLELPDATAAAPGMFARVWLSPGAAGAAEPRLFVPAQALVRRAELFAVYVIDGDGRPLLRQVRPGRGEGGEIEILSGLATGERVALEPQVAARIR